MTAPALNLVVIRAIDVERALRFYRSLGLSFVKEQHGEGPEHFAAESAGVVFEIYPSGNEPLSPTAVRLGFRVASLADALAAVAEHGGTVVGAPRNTPWGRRA